MMKTNKLVWISKGNWFLFAIGLVASLVVDLISSILYKKITGTNVNIVTKKPINIIKEGIK